MIAPFYSCCHLALLQSCRGTICCDAVHVCGIHPDCRHHRVKMSRALRAIAAGTPFMATLSPLYDDPGSRFGRPTTVPPVGERVRAGKASVQPEGAVSHGPRCAFPLLLRQGQGGHARACGGQVKAVDVFLLSFFMSVFLSRVPSILGRGQRVLRGAVSRATGC